MKPKLIGCQHIANSRFFIYEVGQERTEQKTVLLLTTVEREWRVLVQPS